MIDTPKKQSVRKWKRIISTAAALVCLSAATVFAADYVSSRREIRFFDSAEELAEQYTTDNPGYVPAIAAPNSAQENEKMQTAAEYVAFRMEHGMYGGELVLSDETDDLPETPWERRKVSSCYYPEYGIIRTEYSTASSYAEGFVVEDFLDWDLSALSQWLTPVEDGQILSVSRKPVSKEIVMMHALLGYTTQNGKRFNLNYNYDEAARLESNTEYVLTNAYDRVEIYVTSDNVETLIEEYDGQIWARAVNGQKTVSIYTNGCTTEEMQAILDSLDLSSALG